MVTIDAIYGIFPQGGGVGQRVEGQWLHAVEPDYKGLINNMNQRRRMGRHVKMVVGAMCGAVGNLQAAGGTVDYAKAGVIVATGLGAIGETEKFGRDLAPGSAAGGNPVAFIGSTGGSAGGGMALLKGIKGYNMTHSMGVSSVECGLEDAMSLLEDERSGEEKIIFGAGDEMTELTARVLGGLKRGVVAGEGAVGMVLSREAGHREGRVRLLGVGYDEGWQDAAEDVLKAWGVGRNDIGKIYVQGHQIPKGLEGIAWENTLEQTGWFWTQAGYGILRAATDEGTGVRIVVSEGGMVGIDKG